MLWWLYCKTSWDFVEPKNSGLLVVTDAVWSFCKQCSSSAFWSLCFIFWATFLASVPSLFYSGHFWKARNTCLKTNYTPELLDHAVTLRAKPDYWSLKMIFCCVFFFSFFLVSTHYYYCGYLGGIPICILLYCLVCATATHSFVHTYL